LDAACRFPRIALPQVPKQGVVKCVRGSRASPSPPAWPWPLPSLAAPPPVPIAAAPDAALAARLDKVVDTAVAEQRLVGTVVLVARDGKVVYHRAAGLADREAGRPMREDAVFRFSSVTKPFVTAAVMKLVEDGKLNLDDPVTRGCRTSGPSWPTGPSRSSPCANC
jgi:CubicO group peptidase (beta-lactamase class C family)